MPPNNKRISYEQQIAMGLVKPAPKGFRSAQSLGLPVEQPPANRQATITRIEPPAQRLEPIHGYVPPQQTQQLRTSHKDKTDAYMRRMRPLTILFGGSLSFAFVALDVVPFWSLGFASLLLICSLACLLGGEIVYQLFSPDGIGLASEWWRHRRLSNEQNRIYNILEKGMDPHDK